MTKRTNIVRIGTGLIIQYTDAKYKAVIMTHPGFSFGHPARILSFKYAEREQQGLDISEVKLIESNRPDDFDTVSGTVLVAIIDVKNP